MRKLVVALLGSLVGWMGFYAPAQALEPEQETRIFKQLNLVGTGCLSFVDSKAVEFRKEQWRLAIERLAELDKRRVEDWIVGAAPPPEVVIAESTRQKDCLIEAMVLTAADPDSYLVLDWWDEVNVKSQMKRIRDRFESDPRFRASIIRQISRSSYRDARTQSWIWKRKFTFRTNSFNRVSPRAGEKCNIQHGRTWNPAISSHERCWFNVLSFKEREREILVASSAPGISRHHWGTDFDLFSLNPINFVDGKRLADEYRWLFQHGYQFGFVQPYRNPTSEHQYMEERWHWTYYPVAQALKEYAAQHEPDIKSRLFEQWDAFEKRWNRNRRNPVPFFDYVREHWHGFVFNTRDELP